MEELRKLLDASRREDQGASKQRDDALLKLEKLQSATKASLREVQTLRSDKVGRHVTVIASISISAVGTEEGVASGLLVILSFCFAWHFLQKGHLGNSLLSIFQVTCNMYGA